MWRISPRTGYRLGRKWNLGCVTYADDAKTVQTPNEGPQATVIQMGTPPPSPAAAESTTTPTAKPSPIKVPKISQAPISVEPPASLTPQVCTFDSVPGPQSLRLISRFWNHVPLLSAEFTGGALFQAMNMGRLFGNLLTWGGNARFFQKFFDIYGPVVRLHAPFGGDVVLISRPEHASVVLKSEGAVPIRACLDSVEQYRLQHRRLRQAGPFLMSGVEWEKVHETLEKPLESPNDQHYETIASICDQFIDRLSSIRNLQDEVPRTFKNEILKWCLESICSVTLNRKLGFLDPTGLSSTSDPGRILDAVNGSVEAVKKCEYGFHLWKFVETPAWKTLVKNCDVIDSILSKYVERAQSGLREKKDLKSLVQLSMVETLLLKDDVLVEDVMTVMLDMLLIGANATAHSVAFLLYHLAKSPRCQKKLQDEIANQPDVTIATVKNMLYLQACIKESMRLSPPIPILTRILTRDAVIHKYKVPKGTYVLIAVHLASLREEYFEDAKKFNPDRWLSPDISPMAEDLQVFASMPFGHGPKSAQAQELTRNEIALLLAKILQKFNLEYNYGEIESSNALLATPTKPLNFRFIDRV